MSVLIHAPQANIRRLLCDSLAGLTPVVREAASAAALFELVQDQLPNLLISIWPMRDVDGPTLLRAIRTLTRETYCYVLLLGRAEHEAALMQGLTAGADDYLVTPLRRADFQRRVILGLRIAGLEERLHQLSQEHHQLRTHDVLTGLLTRQALFDRLSTFGATIGRTTVAISLIHVRLENLSAINREYGYAVGNQAIQYLATSVMGSVRQGDLVGRWSGPALLLILPDTPLEAAKAVATRVQARINATPVPLTNREPLALPVRVQVVTTSMGVRSALSTLVQQAEAI